MLLSLHANQAAQDKVCEFSKVPLNIVFDVKNDVSHTGW